MDLLSYRFNLIRTRVVAVIFLLMVQISIILHLFSVALVPFVFPESHQSVLMNLLRTDLLSFAKTPTQVVAGNPHRKRQNIPVAMSLSTGINLKTRKCLPYREITDNCNCIHCTGKIFCGSSYCPFSYRAFGPKSVPPLAQTGRSLLEMRIRSRPDAQWHCKRGASEGRNYWRQQEQQ